MVNKKELVAYAKSLSGKKNISYDKRIMHPVREWFLGLLIFITVVFAGGAYSASLFIEYRNISAKGGTSDAPVAYNHTLALNVLDQYREKKAHFMLLKEAVEIEPVIIEPQEMATSTEPQNDTEEEDLSEINQVLMVE